jgi:hypothetical protein
VCVCVCVCMCVCVCVCGISLTFIYSFLSLLGFLSLVSLTCNAVRAGGPAFRAPGQRRSCSHILPLPLAWHSSLGSLKEEEEEEKGVITTAQAAPLPRGALCRICERIALHLLWLAAGLRGID